MTKPGFKLFLPGSEGPNSAKIKGQRIEDVLRKKDRESKMIEEKSMEENKDAN